MRIFVGNPAPIEGAEVFLDEVSVGLTGTDGSLAISEVSAGSHTIRAHKVEYGDATATISVPETGSVILTLTLITYKVAVITILPGSSIYVDGNYVGETTLDPLLIGMLMVEVPYGTHEFKATRSGFKDAIQTVNVTSDMTVELIQEPLTYTITVSVQGSGPIAGASVYFDYNYFGSTDSAGGISIGEVTEGWHNIWAEKAGYHSAGADIYVPRTTSVTLRMTPIAPPLGEIRVKVSMWVVGHLYPLSGAPIYLDGVLAGKADTDGLLTITGVSEGTHKVKVAPAALTPITKSVTVPDGYAAFVFYLP